MPITVGAYRRISDDTEGDGHGVANQAQDLERLAAARRWQTVPYEDNDLSAYQKKVVRPQFEQMLKDLKAGIIQGIVAVDRDRLVRKPKDLERLIDIYEDNPNLVCATLQGDVDLVTTDGRTMARVLVAFANKSSADTGRRIRSTQEKLAAEGKHHGGQIPWFLSRDEKIRAQARKEILAAHEKILAGASVNEVRMDWVARGVRPNSRGAGEAGLSHRSVKAILTSPTLAGFKVYRGEIVLKDGEPIKGAWEPLCTPERLEAVKAKLAKRARQPGVPSIAATTYLLSGIARCGICASPMRGKLAKRADGSRWRRYLCDKSYSDGRGCGKVARAAEPVDELIIALALADEERRKAAPKTDTAGWEQEDRLRAVLAEIDELTEAKIAGRISVATLLKVLPPLERERDELQLAKRRLSAQAALADVLNTEAQENFDKLTLPAQRERILRSIRAVVIKPAGRGSRKFDPDLIEPIWAP